MRIWIIIIGLIWGVNASGQRVEELYKSLDTVRGDSLRADIVERIIDQEMHLAPQRALDWVDTAVAIAQRMGKPALEARLDFYKRGAVYAAKGDYIKALELYDAYIGVFSRESEGDGYFLIDVGNVYFRLALYDVARRYYEQAGEVFEAGGFYRGLGTVYSNFSLIAQRQGQRDTAFYYIDKALELQRERVRDSFQLAVSYWTKGALYMSDSVSYAAAILRLDTAARIMSDTVLRGNRYYSQFIYLLPMSYINLAESYLGTGEGARALEYGEMALRVGREVGNERVLASLELRMGRLLWKLGIADRQEEAQMLLVAGLSRAKQNGSEAEAELGHQFLADYYSSVARWDSAYLNLRYRHEMRDSAARRQDRFLRINDGILQYEHRKTIAEQKRLIAAEERILWIMLALLLVVGLLLVIATWVWRFARKTNKEISRTVAELRASNAVKDRILGVVGHDLRGVFGVLMGGAQALAKDLPSGLSAQRAQQLHQGTKQAYAMVEELLQWAALQRERLETNLEEVNLEELIKDTLAPMQFVLAGAGVGLDWALDGAIVRTDAGLLRVVLRNLLMNAIKESPSGATIRIFTRAEGAHIQLSIEDEGMGIPDALLNDLFSERSGLQIAQRGGGMGLEIVKTLCDKLGVSISAHNLERGGAVFTILLPNIDQQIIQNQPKTSPEIANTHSLAHLQGYAEQLGAYEVFELSDIQAILDQISAKFHDNATKKWLARTQNALLNNDAEQYNKALAELNGN